MIFTDRKSISATEVIEERPAMMSHHAAIHEAATIPGSEFLAKMASLPPFNRMHPRLAEFFRDYLSAEKFARFGDRYVLNTHFPPYPSPAFDRMAEHFGLVGESGPERQLYSVTWAVTNRCNYRCWHCYNAGRSQTDLPTEFMRDVAAQLDAMGVTVLALTGGEPLLRDDLEEIAACFDDRTSLIVGTTGEGLTRERATALADAGVFALGVSLDSPIESEHDRLRGMPGAFATAHRALDVARQAGLYTYVVGVATREFLQREKFMDYMHLAKEIGAYEVHLLEPSPTGRLAGHDEVALNAKERRMILDYQHEIAARPDLPVLSSLTYLESAGAFGCGAGLTHMYIDGSAEVCPCNLVPLSFGNLREKNLAQILERMEEHFRQPRCACVGRRLSAEAGEGQLPAPFERSAEICSRCLTQDHQVPRFYEMRAGATEKAGEAELRAAYDQVHGDYDEFWLTEAARPVDKLIAQLGSLDGARVFEAGCGTGYGTKLLAERLGEAGILLAADISEGMLVEARQRLGGTAGVRFLVGDALKEIEGRGPFDLVISTWVLGYIPPQEFFLAAARELDPGGRLAFVVHRQNSPRRELAIFAELIASDPAALTRAVNFDFPGDAEQVREQLTQVGLEIGDLHEGEVAFEYSTPLKALEHLLKSGAGTAFYDAVDPAKRDALAARFLERLSEECDGGVCRVVHDYVSCVAIKKEDDR
jgi:MoaA/NifB/PqqE/SkfB family radical SAM enzyme/SAM-dependent methyltransferase